ERAHDAGRLVHHGGLDQPHQYRGSDPQPGRSSARPYSPRNVVALPLVHTARRGWPAVVRNGRAPHVSPGERAASLALGRLSTWSSLPADRSSPLPTGRSAVRKRLAATE